MKKTKVIITLIKKLGKAARLLKNIIAADKKAHDFYTENLNLVLEILSSMNLLTKYKNLRKSLLVHIIKTNFQSTELLKLFQSTDILTKNLEDTFIMGSEILRNAIEIATTHSKFMGLKKSVENTINVLSHGK